jgi:alkylhydroperoxidase family enzyme
MSPTLQPVEPPYSEEVERLLGRLMPAELGLEPLLLFRVLAANVDLAGRAYPMASGLLNKGRLPARDREIVIGRTTARAGAEYEWGVHAVIFGPRVGLDEAFLDALVTASADQFNDDDRLLVEAVDQLQDSAVIARETWESLGDRYENAQLVELVLLNGWYRTLSTLISSAEIPLEPWSRRFPQR